MASAEIIKSLDLTGHIEGGYFRRTFQSDHRPLIPTDCGKRFNFTSIYYLLTEQSPVGHFNLNKSDVVHYFHMGDSITYYLIHPDGRLEVTVMGTNLLAGEKLQLTVHGGIWKACKLTGGPHGYGLISEGVSPGFEYEDMTLGERETLLKEFTQHTDVIVEFTRDSVTPTK